MAHVVTGGSREFDMAFSGEPHPSTVQYLRNQVESLGQFVGTASAAWIDRVQDSYNRFSSDDALRHARAAMRKVSSYFQADNIRELTTLGQVQNAPVMMQRFLMAVPEIRQMYMDQRIDGYSSSYVDMQPGMIGEDHYDYRRVMQGRVIDLPVSEENPEGGWKVTTFFDELHEGDRELRLQEQNDVLSSAELMRCMMATALDDPTSQTGGLL